MGLTKAVGRPAGHGGPAPSSPSDDSKAEALRHIAAFSYEMLGQWAASDTSLTFVAVGRANRGLLNDQLSLGMDVASSNNWPALLLLFNSLSYEGGQVRIGPLRQERRLPIFWERRILMTFKIVVSASPHRDPKVPGRKNIPWEFPLADVLAAVDAAAVD